MEGLLRYAALTAACAAALLCADAARAAGAFEGRIAFTTNRDGNREIYAMSPDGSLPVRITESPLEDRSPSWSGDAARLAFVRVEEDGDIFVVNADGTGLQRVTDDAFFDQTPSLSPDGTKIVFASLRPSSNYDLWVVNVDGTGLTRLTTSASHDFNPEWSPDGELIAFDRNGDIWLVTADGSEETRLTFTIEASENSPTWSADGALIAFGGSSGIGVMNADGTARRTIVEVGARPTFAPDGRLAYEATVGVRPDLFTVNADGSGAANITETSEFEELEADWSGPGVVVSVRPRWTAGIAASPPVLDGVIGSAEWEGATTTTVPTIEPDTGPDGQAWFMNDGEYLYLAYRVADPIFSTNRLFWAFDNDADGVAEEGDEGLADNADAGSFDSYWDALRGVWATDSSDDGTDDLRTGWSYDFESGTIAFEAAQPLDSLDDGHDFSLAPGSIVGFNLEYLGGAFSTSFPSPDSSDRALYGELVISLFTDTDPPDLTLLEPAPGAWLNDSFAIAATAEDPSGVDRVEFWFAHPDFDTTLIATDTEPPYEAVFDPPVGMADTDQLTIQARAFDAGGNNTMEGHVVTLDRTDPTGVLTEPAPGLLVDGLTTLAADAADATAGIASVAFEVSADRESWAPAGDPATDPPFEALWDTTAVADGAWWVAARVTDRAGNDFVTDAIRVFVDNAVSPEETLTVDQFADFASLDPALADGANEARLADATCAYLYRARDADGVPEAEAAAGPPDFDPEKVTYRITLREGLAFSDGEPVTPASYKRGIERALRLGGLQAAHFTDIEGADSFVAGYDESLSGLQAGDRDLVFQLRQPSGDLAARLSLPGACPVPEDTPFIEPDEPLPGSGPFYLASHADGEQAVLRLNPHYGADRPQGLRRIVFRFGLPLAQVATAIESGETDTGQVAPADLSRLREEYAGTRYFEPHAPVLWYLALNTNRFPMNDVRVRRAVNIALDRPAAAALAPAASPTDQVLPRTVPGFADSVIYPSGLTDLSAAQALVADADATGSTVRLYTFPTGFGQTVAQVVQASLAEIGLEVEVVTFPRAEQFARMRNADEPFDMGLTGWAADYLDPFNFFHPLLHSSNAGTTNLSWFAHENVDSPIDALRGLHGDERYAAAAELDEEVMRDHAPIAPLFETRTPVFVSDRIGCLRFQPQFGLSLVAACRGAESEGLSLEYGPTAAEVDSAYSRVRYGDLPAEQLRFGSSDESIAGAPLDAVPLDAVDLAGTPLDAVPLDAVTLDAAALESVLGGVLLSSIPVDYPGGWEAILAGTSLANVPLQTVTLADVLSLDPKPEALAPPPGSGVEALPLDAVDFSGTPLDAVPLSALLIGSLPLDAVPLDAVGGWCAAINAVPGYSCPSPIDPATTSLFALALQGFPLDAVPLDAVPLDAVDLSGTAFAHIPLDAVDLAGSPLDAVPLDAVDYAVSPLDAVPLDAVLLSSVGSALRALPLDAVPVDALACALTPGTTEVACPATLGDAFDAGLVAEGATLGDIAPALAGVTLGELGAYGDVTLAGVLQGLPPEIVVTLHDLLELLLTNDFARDWDALDLDSVDLGQFAFDPSSSTWRAEFRSAGGPLRSTLLVRAATPAGFTFTGATLTADGAETPVGPPEIDGGELRWRIRADADVLYRLEASFLPTFDPGAAGSTAALEQLGTAAAPASDGPAVTQVVERYEPENDHPDTAPVLEADSFYLTHGGEGDIDYFRIPVPADAGAKVRVSLSHATFDGDLAGFGAPVLPLKPDAPLRAEPLAADAPIELPLAASIPPETLNDVPLDAVPLDAVAVRSISSNRGTADEELVLVSQGEGGEFTVQVTGFEGSGSYMLRYEVLPAPSLAPCALAPLIGSGTPGSLPASLPAGVNTLFVLNQERLGREFGQAAAADVVAALEGLAGRADLGIVGALVPVEGDPAVAAAYGALDAAPCAPIAANEVFREIARVVDGYRADHPGIEHVVLVGTDRQIPHARVLDESVFAPETDYAARFAGTGSPLEWSFGLGYLLTDDPYGDAHPAEFLGHQLFVPDVGLGRLVESPADILGQIARFQAANGTASVASELTTGYDFLTDGAQATATALSGASGPDTELISEDWSRDDWLGRAFPAAGGGPLVNALNAHFDHQRALPALENALSRETELLTTEHIESRGPDAVLGRLFISIGCHSALNVADGTVPAALGVDWVDTLMGQSAFGFAGNTGFGLGDTLVVAYSERLQELIAERLDGTMTVGRAVAFAKQEYIGELALLTGYDEKVSLEHTFYGLPMLRVGDAPLPAAPAPLPTSTDLVTGLTVATTTLAPSFTRHDDAERGSWYEADGVNASDRRPLEPVVRLDVSQPALTAHGVALTGLASTDEEGFDAAFSRVIVDSSDERELVGEGIYPSRLQALRTIATPEGRRQQAVLFAGQFRSDDVPDARGVGVQRLYTSLGVKVYYSTSADFRAPSISSVRLALVGPNVSFAVQTSDREGEVLAADVLYQDQTGVWRRAPLARTPDTDRWTGGGPVAGQHVVYFVQVVDEAGNVGLSSFKGQLVPIVAEAPTGGIGFTIEGPEAENGWYAGPVDVAVGGGEGVLYELSVDGSPFAVFAEPVQVSGDGVHELRARGSDGSRAHAFVGIDGTPPTIALRAPADGAVLPLGSTPPEVEYACADAGSGVTRCEGSQPSGTTIDTSTVGVRTLTVEAEDAAGNETAVERTYEVRYVFAGFFEPVANLPTLNVAKAGSTVPMKFSLDGDQGMAILAPGYPRSVAISCAAPSEAPAIEETSSVGSGLRFTDGIYHYNWKTSSAWAGTCRQFVLGLADGSFHRASFRFR